MRLSKAGFLARVNSDLRLRFEAQGLTSYAGLELIRRYFRSIDLTSRIRRHLGSAGLGGDYGVVAMVLLVLGLLICGGRRMQHLLYLKDDPEAPPPIPLPTIDINDPGTGFGTITAIDSCKNKNEPPPGCKLVATAPGPPFRGIQGGGSTLCLWKCPGRGRIVKRISFDCGSASWGDCLLAGGPDL